jgi:VCBS repeat protein/FG-GAP repeat protein
MSHLRFLGLIVLGVFVVGSPAARSQQSYKTQQSLRSSSEPTASQPPQSRALAHSRRFLGWRQAAKQGPDTVRYFQKLARRAPTAPRVGVGMAPGVASLGSHATARMSLTQASSANLPGILLRPSLPAGALPSGIVTGDFNGDGKLDWIVANAADNSLDLYLGNGDGTSQLPVIIPLSGQSPVGIAVADLNGDKKLDLVVAEADSNSVGILFGNGDGTFQPEVELTIANAQPLGVAVADLNDDGHPDLLVAVAGDGVHVNSNFGVLLNDGTGHFASPIYAPNPQSGELVVGLGFSVADANGDGIPDVLVTGINAEGSTAQLFFGNGDGTFSGGTIIASSNQNPVFPTDVGQAVLADVNGDGCPDVTVGISNALVFLFFNDCHGNFPQAQSRVYGVGDAAQSLAVVDINGDGQPDIVVGGIPLDLGNGSPIGYSTGNTLTVLLNDGSGNFGPAQIYRGDPGMVALIPADLKSDGHPAIITANQDANSVTLFANDGSGGFGQPLGGYDGFETGVATSPANAPGSAVVAVDLNGDGKPDLALVELAELGSFNNMGTLTVLLNQGGGHFSDPIRTPVVNGQGAQVGDFIFGDFRNTGLPDFLAELVSSASGGPQLIYAPNLGGGQFGPPVNIPFATPGTDLEGFAALAVGDFNKDGKLDFAVASFTGATGTTQQLTVYLGNGDGTFKPPFETSFGQGNGNLFPAAVFVGDANGDGKPDIFVWIGTDEVPGSGNDLFEFLGNGDGTFQPAKDVLQHLTAMTMADLNHDGILDIISLGDATSSNGDSVAQAQIYMGQPNATFGIPTSYSPYAGFLDTNHGDNVAFGSGISSSSYVGDFTGDGNLDIAIFQQSSLNDGPSWVQFLLGNGDGTFTPTFDVFQLGIPEIPDFTVPNLFGDARSAFVQAPNFTSSFQIIPSENAPPFQLVPAEIPVIGGKDTLEVMLNVPSTSDTTLTLSASDPNVIIPASTTIPAGQVSVEVPFTLANSIAPNRWFSLTAQAGTTTQTAYDFPGRVNTDSFLLQVVPPSLTTVQQGGISELWSAGLQSNGDASGSFQLSCSGLPMGASCQFERISAVSVTGGGFENVIFSVIATFATPPGTYTFNVVATDGVSVFTSVQQIQVTSAPSSLVVNPVALTFGPTLNGLTSPAQSITVTNPTSATVAPFVIGPPANNQPAIGTFQDTTTCGSTLGANSSCTVQVAFVASQPGTITDQISVGGSVGFVLIPLSGTAADLALQAAPGDTTAATIQAGQSAVFNLQIASTLFQGAISFTCSGAPPKGGCVVPSSVNVSSNGVVPFQVTVTTSNSAIAPNIGTRRFLDISKEPLGVIFTCLAAIMSLAVLRGICHGRRISRAVLVAFFCCAAIALANCGGGGTGGGGGGGGGGNMGTPPGTYPLMVTGSVGNATRSIQLTVTVTSN